VIAGGGSVITIDSTVHVPGAIDLAAEELTEVLTAAAVPDLKISPPPPTSVSCTVVARTPTYMC
jgi:hypothetical protein